MHLVQSILQYKEYMTQNLHVMIKYIVHYSKFVLAK